MTKEEINKITEDVAELLLKKNEDYGGASFDLGLNGNMVHLWDKIKRYRQLIEKQGKEPNFESMEDTLKDIIGYGIIGLLIMKEEDATK